MIIIIITSITWYLPNSRSVPVCGRRGGVGLATRGGSTCTTFTAVTLSFELTPLINRIIVSSFITLTTFSTSQSSSSPEWWRVLGKVGTLELRAISPPLEAGPLFVFPYHLLLWNWLVDTEI